MFINIKFIIYLFYYFLFVIFKICVALLLRYFNQINFIKF